MKYTYGGSWERYPIEPGQIWRAGTGTVAVNNLFAGMPEFMLKADCIFVDPPWNLGNVNTFYNKAEQSDRVSSFELFTNALFAAVRQIDPDTIYIEMGDQNIKVYEAHLRELFPFQQTWAVKYYNKHPCNIVRASKKGLTGIDYTGLDELKVIADLAKRESYQTIGDICMGRGALGREAFAAGRPFVGTELNKRRLAVMIDKIAQKGGQVGQITI